MRNNVRVIWDCDPPEGSFCAICGAHDQLAQDANQQGVYYCGECLDRSNRHQAAIDGGYEKDDVPFNG